MSVKPSASESHNEGVPSDRQIAAWILQGNPDLYDIDTYISRQTFIYWNCPRYGELMSIGMPVFFKRSGHGGGLIAHGTIGELPKPADQVDRPEFLGRELWHSPAESTTPKVGVQLDEVRLTIEEGMVTTQVLQRIGELFGHPLVTVRQGTVFQLNEHQALGVFRAWAGDMERTESIDATTYEGRRRLVVHQRIERNRQLIEDKKRTFREQHGQLSCEVCQSDFARQYPSDCVDRIIEVHHLRPLFQLSGPTRTNMEDLILVCSNCHAIIHRTSECEENLRQLQQHFGARETHP